MIGEVLPHVYTPAQRTEMLKEHQSEPELITGLLPCESIGILAGCSGIGKSAFLHQIALCVTAGVPFLGMAVQKAPVLYLDIENSPDRGEAIEHAIGGLLELPVLPETLHLTHDIRSTQALELYLARCDYAPGLIIVDTLRSFDSDAEEKNSRAARLMLTLRTIAGQHHTAILVAHHLNKPTVARPEIDLADDSDVLTWLHRMAGASALVNQSDVRIAAQTFEKDRREGLRLRWNRRTYGDSLLLNIERLYDETDKPLGYCAMTGLELLSERHCTLFVALPAQFRFADLKAQLGGGSAARLRDKLIQGRLARYNARLGVYEKLEAK